MSCKCFTFYSYKGGSGRTTTLVNTTKHLIKELGASPSAPILVVDLDLESAGLTYFFETQDKFSGLFADGIHACRFLKEFDRFSSIFGSTRSFLGKSFEFLKEDLKKHFSSYDIEALFTSDMKLKETEMAIFSKIVSSWAFRNRIDVEAEDELDRQENLQQQAINETYGENFIKKLLEQLTEIQNDSTVSNKSNAKLEAIREALPASTVVDVSNCFKEEKGTVKFLGVYVSDNGEQAVSNQSLRALRYLCKELDKNNYKAVIFDSGAGKQSSAHALHQVSHVMTCCMRPSSQFLKGTRTQLDDYEEIILSTAKYLKKKEGTKSVIILPTAVPENDGTSSAYAEMSFNEIRRLASDFESVVDDRFCSEDTCLNEVGIFKWREQILGVDDADRALRDYEVILDKLAEKGCRPSKEEENKKKAELIALAKTYASYESMPQDAKRAYDTYKNLAKYLAENARERE